MWMTFGFTSEGVVISLSAVADGSLHLASAIADEFGVWFSAFFPMYVFFLGGILVLNRKLYRFFLSSLRKESCFFSHQSFNVLSLWVPQLRMNPRFDLPPLRRNVGFHRPILRAHWRSIIGFSPCLSPRSDLVYGFPPLQKAFRFTLRPKVVSRPI